MATEIPPTELMRLYDNYEAPLPGGSYRFVLQQTVTVGDEAERHYYRDQKFEVVAPRYSIEPDEVQAYFPPPGGVANYQNALPHVVLRTRNLPWERTLSAREPWLALLVLSDQEIRDGRVIAKTGKVADLQPQSSGEQILLPNITHKEDPNTPVRLLDMDLDLFLKVCPRREELPLLAHIRHVDIADKVPLDMVANGEFSVIVGNRFPQAGANTIYLISLEGLEKIFDARSGQSARVRLITLANWSFVCDSSGSDSFAGLMQQLRKNAAQFGIALPVPSSSEDVNQALAKGYVPLDYRPLDSTPAFSWYRGPLSPLMRRPMTQPAFKRADTALIFDERTGLMDVSYAAAWELGRLLALGSPAFTKGLRLFVEQSQNATEFARQIANFIEVHRSAFDTSEAPKPKEEQVAIAEDLVEWLARLVLLYPVPFHYLVPHALLLPPESVRFFHLDDNWVETLVDGALSIAVTALNGKDLAARADLQATLSTIVYQHRLRLQGKSPEWNPTERYMDIPKSGFLLRSSILAGWPGIEVTVTTNAAPDRNLPKILRYDQVSDGVLFCLARGSIEQLIFREPREGLSFGVTSDGEIESDQRVNVKRDLKRRDSLDGVVDIAVLRDKLACTGSAQLAVKMLRRPEEQLIEWK